MGSPAESGSVGMSAVELADGIRGRGLDPVQVTAAHLERIRAVDPGRARHPTDPGHGRSPTRAAGLARPIVERERPVRPRTGRAFREQLVHGRIPRAGPTRRHLAGGVAQRRSTRRGTRRRRQVAVTGQHDRTAPTMAPTRTAVTNAERRVLTREGSDGGGYVQVRRHR
jgi:hypothetical protein